MENYLIKKHEAVPYANELRLKHKTNGKLATLKQECQCTETNLHYEVLYDGQTKPFVFQHTEIEELFDVLL